MPAVTTSHARPDDANLLLDKPCTRNLFIENLLSEQWGGKIQTGNSHSTAFLRTLIVGILFLACCSVAFAQAVEIRDGSLYVPQDLQVDNNVQVNNDVQVSKDLAVLDDFEVSNTELHIDSDSQRVGIGTTSPRSMLDVNGKIMSSGNSIELGQRSGIRSSYIDLRGDNTYSNYGLRFIRGSGGANTPSQIIHRGTGILGIMTYDKAPLHFITNRATRMAVTPSGNVGIGTTNPSAKLHVKGGNTHLERYLRLKDFDGNRAHYSQTISRDGNWMFHTGGVVVGRYNNNQVGKLPTGTMIVKGKLGLGTTKPGADKLDVRGRAYASRGWHTRNADYAEWFEKQGNPQPGDLIGIDRETGKAKTYESGDLFIGVYSTHPAFIGNRIAETDEELQETHVLVGLLGQLDVDMDQVKVVDRVVYTLDGEYVGILLSSGKVFVK